MIFYEENTSKTGSKVIFSIKMQQVNDEISSDTLSLAHVELNGLNQRKEDVFIARKARDESLSEI